MSIVIVVDSDQTEVTEVQVPSGIEVELVSPSNQIKTVLEAPSVSRTVSMQVGTEGPQGLPGKGVPAGGSIGQVLKKKTATDYELEWASLTSGITSYNDLTDKPSTFPPSAHSHAVGDITGLSTTLSNKSDIGHVHSISDVTNLATSLSSKAEDAIVVKLSGAQTIDGVKIFTSSPVVPDASFAISKITGLQTALDNKQVAGSYANTTHSHAISDVTGLSSALTGKADDTVVVKLSGAQTIAGVKTFSSAPVVPDASFSIAKTSGLQTALDGKQAAGSYAAATHTHAISDVTNLSTTLAGKADDTVVVKLTGAQTIAGIKTFSSSPVVPDASFSIAKTSGLQSALDGKAASTHSHPFSQITDGTSAVQSIVNTQLDIAGAPATLDTINELAAALGDDANFASTVTNSLAGKEPTVAAGTTAQYYRGDKSWQTLDKASVGLANVDNTSDTNKPISSATQTALNNKANDSAVVHLTGAETVAGVKTFSASPVVPDSSFAISKITNLQTVLDGKASSSHTHTLSHITDVVITSPANGQALVYNSTNSRWENLTIASGSSLPSGGTTAHYLRGDQTWQTLDKTAVGLANVDNTSDANKPVSTATQTALNAKANDNAVVHLTGAETVAGTKTFSSSPVVPDASFTVAKTSGLQSALDGKATDTAVVHLSGAETIAGVKTFSSSPVVPDSSFGISKTSGLQSALDAKAPIASPTFTGTVSGISKSMVGLGNVDNTADTAKPVSTAQQTALDNKQPLDADLTSIAALTTTSYGRSLLTVADAAATKVAAGLGNVDNTSDVNKPVSTAQQTALNAKENTISAGTTSQYWRGDKSWQTLDKSAVGLANVDNTSDLNKPVSTATSTAISNASTNDRDRANHSGTQAISTITNLQTTLDAKVSQAAFDRVQNGFGLTPTVTVGASATTQQITDNVSALQAASDALEAFGGGTIRLPAGIILGWVDLGSKVAIQGQGIEKTIFRRPSTRDGNTIGVKNWSTLVYTANDGTLSDITIRDMTVDGNRAAGGFTVPITNTPPNVTATPSTSGGTLAAGTYVYVIAAGNVHGQAQGSSRTYATTTGSTGSVALTWPAVSNATKYYVYGRDFNAPNYGLRLITTVTTNSYTDTGSVTAANMTKINPYFGANTTAPAAIALHGWRPKIENVRVFNAPGTGIHTYWQGGGPPTGNHSMEAHWDGVYVEMSGLSNLVWDGPHDSMIANGTFANPGQASQVNVATIDNVIVESNGPVRFVSPHAWGQARYAFALWGQSDLYDFQAEGALVSQVHVSCDDVHLIGGEIFFPGNGTAKGLTVGQSWFFPPAVTAIGIHAYGFASAGAAIDLGYMGTHCVIQAKIDDGTYVLPPTNDPAYANSKVDIVGATGGILSTPQGIIIRTATGSKAIDLSPDGAIGFGGDANVFAGRIVAGPADNGKPAATFFELTGQSVPVFRVTDSSFTDKFWVTPGAENGIALKGDKRIVALSGATPEGVQNGAIGSIGIASDGTLWRKTTAVGTLTGWRRMADINEVTYGVSQSPVGWGIDADNIITTAATAQTTGVLGRVRFMPVEIGPNAQTFDAMQVQVTTAESGGAGIVHTAGIYSSNADGSLPNVNGGLLRSADIALTSTGTRLTTFTSAVTLTPGRYWIAWVDYYTTAPTFGTLYTITSTISLPRQLNSQASTSNRYLNIASVTALPNALASPTFTSGADSLTPHVLMRRSA